MSSNSRKIVAVLVTATFAGGHGSLVVAGQDSLSSARTLVAVLASIDTEAGTASFRARASVAAARSAEQLPAGEQVRFRWEGPERRRVHRIAEVTPLSASRGTPKAATGRGRFAMNAEFVSVNRRARTMTFSLPMSSDWLDALASFSAGSWLSIRCEIDRQGQVTAITAIDALRAPTAGLRGDGF